MGMDKIEGTIPPKGQLPSEGGKELFESGGQYQYIEGDVRNRFQKDGYFSVEAHTEGSSPSSLQVTVDHNSWSSQDKSPDKESKIQLLADVDEEGDTWKIELRVYDNFNTNSWMGELADDIADTPLARVGLPGTHDSGTYKFNKDKGASPDSDLTATIQDKLDKGRLLGKLTDFILANIFERLCQCQDKSIREQLEAGIRYLDLRIVRHPDDGSFWTCHGVYCVNMDEVLQEINDFLTANPKEIVILDFNHLYEMDEHHTDFCDKIVEVMGDKMAEDDKVSSKSNVSEYWEQGYQAVCLYHKREVLPQYNGKLWSQNSIWSKWPEANDPNVLHDKLGEYIDKRNMDQFFVLQGILTPDVELIKTELLDSGGLSIKKFAERCSCKVVDWCDEEFCEEARLNIVIVDFYENCAMIPSIISYNQK